VPLATVARVEAGGVTVTLRADRAEPLADLARRLLRLPRPGPRTALVYDLLSAPARARVVRNGRTLHAARRVADVVDVLELDLLWQVAAMTDALPLHSAGVVLPGATRALLLVGSSGAGKSSLVLELLSRGARVLGDDHVFVWPDLGASGLPRAVRADGQPERALTPDVVVDRAPVGGVVLLDRPRRARAALEPLAGATAVTALLPHARRATRPADLQALARLVGAVPVARLACEGVAAAADTLGLWRP
jgi:hypothetical protein